MATVKVPVMSVKLPNIASDAQAAAAFAAGDEVLFPCGEKNLRVIVIGSATGNVTFNAGDSPQATNDIVVAATSGKAIAIDLDTASFEITAGTNAGNIKMTPAVAGTAYAIAG